MSAEYTCTLCGHHGTFDEVLSQISCAGCGRTICLFRAGVDMASGPDQTVLALRKNGKTEMVIQALAVAAETDWKHQDWLHSSVGLPDYEESERLAHIQKGEIWCRICEDWIGKNELRRWTGDDQLHYLCPGCGADLVWPKSLEV